VIYELKRKIRKQRRVARPRGLTCRRNEKDTGERNEGDKSTKGIKEMKKECHG
jgi:hypothetical protein